MCEDGRDAVDVAVFYSVPRDVADRAIARFRRRRQGVAPEHSAHLLEYVEDEIRRRPVVHVEGEPLAEYAARAGVEELTIGGDLDGEE